MIELMVSQTTERLFWAKVTKGPGCWLWLASRNPKGYGAFGVAGKVTLAHRVAWQLAQGDIPAGMTVYHLCGNRSCVNPEHLTVAPQCNKKQRDDSIGEPRRRGRKPVPLGDRFWPKVNRGAVGDCWPWQGSICPDGYGRFRLGAKDSYAHRVAYEVLVGPIPTGLTIDHLCRNRCCVNPAHMEPVTLSENSRRARLYKLGRYLH